MSVGSAPQLTHHAGTGPRRLTSYVRTEGAITSTSNHTSTKNSSADKRMMRGMFGNSIGPTSFSNCSNAWHFASVLWFCKTTHPTSDDSPWVGYGNEDMLTWPAVHTHNNSISRM